MGFMLMKRIILICLLLTWSHFALCSDSNISGKPQPPQLLGVWYGSYELPDAESTQTAQIWMLISWQLSQNGWSIAGHNRWNVFENQKASVHSPSSAGQHAEHFERFTGEIARDRSSVEITEKTTGRRIQAKLVTPDQMAATFSAGNDDEALFTVNLNRINNGYQPGQKAVTGLDVSHHSGSVDWNQVMAQGFQFAYIKSSEGVDNPDPMFEENWRGIKQAGLARGAYHFYVTEDDPVDQADFFASRIADDPGDLPPAVDVELLGANTSGDMTETLQTFLETLTQKTGVRPIIYTDSTFWDSHYEPIFSDYGLWMSEYGVRMPKTPFGWDSWAFWQHAQNQVVDGVEKNVDLNLLHPTLQLDELRKPPLGDG